MPAALIGLSFAVTGEDVNRLLNTTLRRALNALMSRRRGRVLAAVVVAAVAVGAAVWPPDHARNQTSSQTSRQSSKQVSGQTGEPDVQSVSHVTAPGGGFVLKGRVVHVADGDTFTVQVGSSQRRIRLASIDAPETQKDAQRRGQPYARASSDALATLVSGKTLTLRCYEKDRYDRSICDVMLPDGSTVNQKQVAAGMAWANMEGKGKFMRDPALPKLEELARQARRGLWRDNDPVRPWVWRYQCWQQQRC